MTHEPNPFVSPDEAGMGYDLTDDEQALLFDALNWVYMAVTKADETGFRTAQREAQAWLDHYLAVRTRYPENVLVQQVFKSTGDKREFHEMLGRSRRDMKRDRKTHRLRGSEDWLNHAKAKLIDVNGVLEAKVEQPDPGRSDAGRSDAMEFRNWLMWVGESIAGAGIRKGATRSEGTVSPQEGLVLAELSLAVGLS